MSAREQPFPLADALDELLPQTQCRKCGYDGCRPYAEALAGGVAAPNQCPPGGEETATALAKLLGVEPQRLDSKFAPSVTPAVALIDEHRCIGCTLCMQACPVDAIVGAAKLMHTVIAEACTGCELCMPPCPVDCIVMLAMPPRETAEKRVAADAARHRFHARKARLARLREERTRKSAAQREARAQRKKRETVAKALERARLRLAQRT